MTGNGQNGKGSKPRPISVKPEEFKSNWEKTFGKSSSEGQALAEERFEAEKKQLEVDKADAKNFIRKFKHR